MTEPLMQDSTVNSTDGNAASQAPDNVQATADALYGDKQQAEGKQDQQAQDGKPADKPEGDKEGEAEGEKPEGAPEKYEFKAPEGREFDAEVINVFSEVAKELNLPQKAAQQMLDRVAPIIEARQVQQIEALRQEWTQTSMADKEFGGEKLKENLSVAKKALDQFGNPQLRELLEKSGLGNHPEVIRFMFKAGKAISEDRYVGPSQGAGVKGQPKDFAGLASALYSNQQP